MKKYIAFVALLFCVWNGEVAAKIVLSPLFSDDMVLQQQCDVPVWGTACPEHVVKVTVSWDGSIYETKADQDGNWRLTVHTPSAGGPYKLTLTDGKKLELNNVMIGEVWLCSGQSNMEMPLYGDWTYVNNYQQEISQANHPNIRLLTVARETDVQPRNQLSVHGGKWQVCSPSVISDFSAVAYFFGRELAETQQVPVGLVLSAWGGTNIEAWISADALRRRPDMKEAVEKVEAVPDKESLAGLEEWERRNTVTGLYNSMIHPLIPFAIRGAIWYQGENNAGRAYQYRELFPLMIADWRKKWGYDFPFYYVQLANYRQRKTEPGESEWAELREAQMQTLKVNGTGMAVIIDEGEADDIHPKNKQVVGHRLALIARGNTYGEQQLDYSGPIYRSHRIEGNRVILSFNGADSGLISKDGNELKGFSIAGHDRKFYWAKAEIHGSQIVVSAPNVEYPIAVRYAWADNPECNLYNGAGLPASPFRTDDWKGVTRKEISPLRVLCLGNSITRHEYKADIEWFSEWGMAASKEENDYCHQLQKMLCKDYPGSVVTPQNIAYWERNLNCNIDSLLAAHVKDKDVIVIRLGENVQDKEEFKTGILRLIEYCKQKARKVVVTGCFWKDDEKERAIIDAARLHGLSFVALNWIDALYPSRPKVGDTLYNMEGKPYTVTKEFIIAHPNDEGMKKIAEAIYGVLKRY